MSELHTRKEKRTPVTLKIKFKSENLDQFIERYSVDVSRGGIFIRTKDPLAVGTQLKFEFQLQDASPLIAGEGTVVWIREYDPSRSGVAPGMGVRFDRRSPQSQPVLEKILTEKGRREAAGAKPAAAGAPAASAKRSPPPNPALRAPSIATPTPPVAPSIPAAAMRPPSPSAQTAFGELFGSGENEERTVISAPPSDLVAKAREPEPPPAAEGGKPLG